MILQTPYEIILILLMIRKNRCFAAFLQCFKSQPRIIVPLGDHSCFLIIANSFVHFLLGLGQWSTLGQFIADNNAASSRSCSSKLSYPMGIHISRPGTRLRSRCLVPCRPGGGQVFRLISRCNFSPFFKRGGPPARPFRGRSLLSRGKVRDEETPLSSMNRGKKEGRLFLSNSR